MTNTTTLKELIASKGLKYHYIADKLGITYAALNNKISNKSEFKGEEIKAFCDILDITIAQGQPYFFANRVD